MFEYSEKIKKLHDELKGLTGEAHELENKIFACLPKLLPAPSEARQAGQRRQENLKKLKL